jgi:hypothetical protein
VGGVSGFGRVRSAVIGRWGRAGRRRCAQLGLRRVAIVLPVAARNYPPAMDLFGSYFPTRILCGTVGIVAAMIFRQLLAVSGGLPESPDLSGQDDHRTALATWYGVLHQGIRKILDQVGPQPQLATAPSVGDLWHAAG